jgi:DNA-directed RNA polymerase subunit RPC12/RpoP
MKIQCANCGNEFDQIRSSTKYCSKHCRSRAFYGRKTTQTKPVIYLDDYQKVKDVFDNLLSKSENKPDLFSVLYATVLFPMATQSDNYHEFIFEAAKSLRLNNANGLKSFVEDYEGGKYETKHQRQTENEYEVAD